MLTWTQRPLVWTKKAKLPSMVSNRTLCGSQQSTSISMVSTWELIRAWTMLPQRQETSTTLVASYRWSREPNLWMLRARKTTRLWKRSLSSWDSYAMLASQATPSTDLRWPRSCSMNSSLLMKRSSERLRRPLISSTRARLWECDLNQCLTYVKDKIRNT